MSEVLFLPLRLCHDLYTDWVTPYFVVYLSVPIFFAMLIIVTGCIVTANGSESFKSKLDSTVSALYTQV